MSFKRYPKIHRLGKEEVDGILLGTCHIQEKIDGANTSIWLDKRGDITCGSRSRELTEGFNGFVDFVKTDERFKNFFNKYPNLRLYGEWLVRHTISYNELAYKKWYLFDITEKIDGETNETFKDRSFVDSIVEEFGFDAPQNFGTFENPNTDKLKEFVGKSNLGENGEGIVIKNLDFIDKWGDCNYAKIVTEKFKEDNGVTFGGNNKHSDTYWEMYIVNKYMTLARIQKIMNKLQPMVDKKLDFEHTSRVIGTAYHDMLTEEIWEISKKVGTINFKNLTRIANKKAVQIYKDILNGDISVADKNE